MRTTVVIFALIISVTGTAYAVSPSSEVVVAAAISAEGAGGSHWIQDLFLDNPGASPAQVDIQFLARNADSSGATSTAVTIPAGGSLVLEDVVGQTLGLQDVGALRLSSGSLFVATSRFVNTVTASGQSFDGLDAGERVWAGEGARIIGLRQGGPARSNLFAVAGASGATYQIELFDLTGGAVGTATRSLPPWAAGFDSLASLLGGFTGDLSATVTVSDGSAWFAGSRVDGADSITLPAVRSLAGTYTGEWVNTTFNSSGDATIVVGVELATRQATVTIDLDGNVFGSSNPPAETYTGTFDSRGMSLSTTSATFGQVDLRISPEGLLAGVGNDVPNPGIDRVVYHGEIGGGAFTMQVLIYFPGGNRAQSVLTLER
jgi:hypothetical protein